MDEQDRRSQELSERLSSRVFEEPLTADTDHIPGVVILSAIFLLMVSGFLILAWVKM